MISVPLSNNFHNVYKDYAHSNLLRTLWCHVQAEDLVSRYGNECCFSFAHKICHLFVLAFLDPNAIHEAFLVINDKILQEKTTGVAKCKQ